MSLPVQPSYHCVLSSYIYLPSSSLHGDNNIIIIAMLVVKVHAYTQPAISSYWYVFHIILYVCSSQMKTRTGTGLYMMESRCGSHRWKQNIIISLCSCFFWTSTYNLNFACKGDKRTGSPQALIKLIIKNDLFSTCACHR